MLIDLVQLRTFVAVAEEQHLTRAAERIHVSLSAASAHVRAIEDLFKTQLFVRTNRNLELTPSGHLLFRRAKALLNEATMLTSFARELRGAVEGCLVIASSGDPVANRIGEIVFELRSRHSLVSVDTRARPSQSTHEGLMSGEVDIGVNLDRPTDASFQYHELSTVQFRVAGPAAWKERIENADWAGLAKLPWITPANSGMAYATILDRLFKDKGLELDSVATFDSAAVGRAMLQAGVGVTLLREDHALEGVKAGYLALSPLARFDYALYVVHLASRKDDPLIRAFLEAAKVVWPDMKLHSASEA
jgi:DNA-binding transcriptional LysR family regulator